MTPEDRRVAREALEQGRLTIAQVEAVQAEADSGGRPFLDVARAKGLLLPPPVRAPRLFGAVIVAIGVVLLGLFAYTIRRGMVDLGGESGDLDAAARFRIETERRSYQAKKEYEASVAAHDERVARTALEKGRAALAAADADPGPVVPVAMLEEAVVGLSAWLDRHPDDVDALLDRARACERRRFLDRALADLEKVSSLRPGKAAELAPRLLAIRKQLPKKD